MTKHVDAIILAAGLSSRMAPKDKLMLPIDGEAMIRRVVRIVSHSSVRNTHVIMPHEGFQGRHDALHGLDVRVCQLPSDIISMGRSLAYGVGQLSDECEACLVVLADMPDISVELIAMLLEQGKSDRIVAPSFEGRRGHPVLFGRDLFAEMLTLGADEGARSVIKRHGDKVQLVPVHDGACLVDLDSPADYQAYIEGAAKLG